MDLWGTVAYSDGARVVLKAAKCTSKPIPGTKGTHECRSHRSHEDAHRCICGLRWGDNRRVIA